MHSDPETLYDAHSPRLYAYCWSLVGDEAPEAVKDTFMAAARLGPPRGDEVLWLYALARSACMRRGALSGTHSDERNPDPLRRAAARLRSDHREVLLLSAGVWLEAPDIARLLGVAPDTVRQLIQAARARLERLVLDALMHQPMSAPHDDIIAAFERGRLPLLLARQVPAEPPAGLRADVLATVTHARPAETNPLPVTVPGAPPLVVMDPRRGRRPDGAAKRRVKGAAELGAIAACAAAAAGLFVAWGAPNGKSTGGGLSAPIPHVNDSRDSGTPATGPEGPGDSPMVPVAPTSTPFTTKVTDVPSAAQPDGSGGGAPSAPQTGHSQPTPPATGGSENTGSAPAPAPSPAPSKTTLGGTLGDTVGKVGDTVGDTVGGPLGDTVGGTVGTVGGIVGGLLP